MYWLKKIATAVHKCCEQVALSIMAYYLNFHLNVFGKFALTLTETD